MFRWLVIGIVVLASGCIRRGDADHFDLICRLEPIEAPQPLPAVTNRYSIDLEDMTWCRVDVRNGSGGSCQQGESFSIREADSGRIVLGTHTRDVATINRLTGRFESDSDLGPVRVGECERNDFTGPPSPRF